MGTVVVVGSINIDLVTVVPRLPSPGETVTGGSFQITDGGKGANQAVAAARLGARTFMVGAVGNDGFGKQAKEVLAGEGVDVSWVATKEGPTGVAQILVDRRGENLIAVASGANGQITGEEVTAALEAVLRPGAVVLSNLEIPEDAVMAAAVAAKKAGCCFILNPAPARSLPVELVRLCDILTPNEHEACALGWPSPEALLELGVKAVVITLGAEGADLLQAGRPRIHLEPFKVSVVDTTGAGDAFSATLAWAVAEGKSLEEAVRLAAAGGALATTRLGARAGFGAREEVEKLAGRGRVSRE